jgi:capsular exopolysaccharide synthesis family protein
MYFGPALTQRHQYQLPSSYPPIQPEPAGQTDVSSIVGTLLRRHRIFLAIFVTFLSLVILWTLLAPRSYTATIKLIAGATGIAASHEGDSALPLLNALLAASSAQSAETYVDLIQQDPVLEQVINNLNLGIGINKLLNDVIAVKPVTNTSIIELDATWSNPRTAVNIANEFGKVFVERERELIAGQAGSALEYLSKQMPVAEASMRKSDSALAAFEASHPNVYVGSSGENQGVDSAILAAQQKFAQLQVDQGQAQAQLANVTGQMSAMSPTMNGQSDVVVNPVVAQLQTQLAQVQVQLETARKQYTDSHPTVIALQEQKSQLEREIRNEAPTVVAGNNIVPNPVYQQLSQQAASLRSQVAGDTEQMQTLRAELGQIHGPSNSLPAQTMQLQNLQRQAKMAEDVYGALQQKFSEATVARTTALSDVAVTEPAALGDVKVKPSWIINLAIGIALGFVLAISGVFIIDFFDNTLKDEEDVQRALPLPLLTSVPQLETNSPKKLPWLRALTVESFLQLVTALRYSSDRPLRTLAITSPNQGDGKSTIAMSTAIAMAEMEPKVLLVDADLRRPTLHDRLGLQSQPGLTDYVVGEASVSEIIQPTKYDGLYLLPSGVQVPNPIKLIHSERFDALMTELLKEYRAIVFDTPALVPVGDAAVLGAKVDGTVLVLAAGMTDMPSTKRALQRISTVQGVNLLGIVLNRTTPTNGYAAYYLSTENPHLPLEEGAVSSS